MRHRSGSPSIYYRLYERGRTILYWLRRTLQNELEFFSQPVHEPVEIVNGPVKKSSPFQPVLKHELLSEFWFIKKKSIENRRN